MHAAVKAAPVDGTLAAVADDAADFVAVRNSGALAAALRGVVVIAELFAVVRPVGHKAMSTSWAHPVGAVESHHPSSKVCC